MKPFFTIILATYNRAGKIDKAIKSVLNQTYTNWELIVVDDGSTDTTSKHVKKFSNVKLISKKHKGVAAARNIGLKKAQGKFITFIDSDDTYREDHLEKHYKTILKNKEVDFFYGGVKVKGSKFVPDFDHPGKEVNVDNCKQAGTFFVRSNVLKKVGGFPNLNFAEDYVLYKNVKAKGYAVKRLYTRSYLYDRTGSDEITKNMKQLR